ncbi:alpha/beta-hydrolase [Ascoidea rubescens DSM 1968]|uniref:Alpha/beta-hydrolase n=1 Tax=Ascoidea rubescens DSM 1968 TaxID=1344418 RepID=A0A1D2VCV1_9ASCO|nr:alpha/beta-hydrolase [Ascoidea rubescens DSM 1968]ODV59402.1 alpha/beta-hydrolase [Ascoidea rubescens DSM 1968]
MLFDIISTVRQYCSPKLIEFVPSKQDGLDSDVDSGAITLKSLIDKNIPELRDKNYFLMNPLLTNGHFQTSYAGLQHFENIDKVYYKRKILNYPDGGIGAIDFVDVKLTQKRSSNSSDEINFLKISETDPIIKTYKNKYDLGKLPPRTRYLTREEIKKLNTNDNNPLLVILHGLAGGSHEAYVRCLIQEITSKDYKFDAVVLNARGCSNSKIVTPRMFNGVWTDDLRCLLSYLKKIYPNKPLYGIGFSLGASMLANYLGQESEESKFTAACVLCNPWDMYQSSCYMHSSSNHIGREIYSTVMTKGLKKLLENNIDAISKNELVQKTLNMNFNTSDLKGVIKDKNKIKYLYDFDDNFTSVMFGFNNANEYYRNGSSILRIPKIRTPLLIINAKDDPIVGDKAIPRKEVVKNPYIVLCVSDYGGHLGWFTMGNKRWYAKPVSNFFKRFHEDIYLKKLEIKADERFMPNPRYFDGSKLIMPDSFSEMKLKENLNEIESGKSDKEDQNQEGQDNEEEDDDDENNRSNGNEKVENYLQPDLSVKIKSKL